MTQPTTPTEEVSMPVIAPPRSHNQRMEALALANEIRGSRAQLKRDLTAERTDAASVLRNPPSWAATMKLFDLLLAVPQIGRVKAMKVLNDCRVSPSKTIGGLSQRQRTELVSRLPAGSP